jgi:chromosome segregation ATPase
MVRGGWRRVQAHPAQAAFGILLVTLLVALTGQTWVWFVGALLVLVVLYPSLFSIGRGSGGGTGVAGSAAVRPDLSQLQGHYREQMQRALAARENIETAISRTQDVGQHKVLMDAVAELPELTNSIYGLALKAQSVDTAMGGTNPIERLTDEIKQLEATIKATNDEFQKSQYYAALDGKLQQMQNLTDTTVAMRRWDSQIENALSTLDTLLSQVLRIKSSEVLSYGGATDELSNSLKREVESLKATAEAMDSVYGWKG